MKRLAGVAVALGVLLVLAGQTAARPSTRPGIPASALNDVVKRYCQRCHSDAGRSGNLSLVPFDVAAAPKWPTSAKRLSPSCAPGMMPPPGEARPTVDTLAALVDALETRLDAAFAANPNPGFRTFQRLNRAEYTAAIRDLLSLDVDAGAYLPLDTKSDNFDNIADAQMLSPTLLDAYLRAASDISWLAIGNPTATTSSATYTVPRTASQTDHVEGAPFGTRGGTSVVHTFPPTATTRSRSSSITRRPAPSPAATRAASRSRSRSTASGRRCSTSTGS